MPNSGTFVDAVAVERRVQDRLQRVERFRKRQEDYLRYKKSKVCLKNKKNLGSLIWVLMVVHLLHGVRVRKGCSFSCKFKAK